MERYDKYECGKRKYFHKIKKFTFKAIFLQNLSVM